MQYANYAAFHSCIADLIDTPEVQAMCDIPQHADISCFGHSVFVAYLSFRICRRLGWDYRAAARGGLLHDLFLYDWRVKGSHTGPHGFTHPRAALENASQLCELTDVEKDIILKHMWPLTPFSFYRYKESLAVSCADKICAFAEAFHIFHRMYFDHRLGLCQRAYLRARRKAMPAL
ncbi:HD family phosphohydrolase [Intestinibacillus massiliensis]|uniref:HD domain-containing protein n=1 Tax=Intestinibacillus massiliensis TaxID=1871029 RepID=UPI000B35671D|nr:HD domain-containing protein [Intestinibacillus massiliensis]MCB6364946.1 HD family phosphohydrolase [Intestinibacillus massiliensis]